MADALAKAGVGRSIVFKGMVGDFDGVGQDKVLDDLFEINGPNLDDSHLKKDPPGVDAVSTGLASGECVGCTDKPSNKIGEKAADEGRRLPAKLGTAKLWPIFPDGVGGDYVA
ncbi:hypothetical protein V6N12_054346 [Hibiscus sabdariffa]|uniref:Uncharacterized protein n=1 Tax=Hibiscus sabdariffa TaxID=183260 RepID=A0ABR2D058_9ROSI